MQIKGIEISYWAHVARSLCTNLEAASCWSNMWDNGFLYALAPLLIEAAYCRIVALLHLTFYRNGMKLFRCDHASLYETLSACMSLRDAFSACGPILCRVFGLVSLLFLFRIKAFSASWWSSRENQKIFHHGNILISREGRTRSPHVRWCIYTGHAAVSIAK